MYEDGYLSPGGVRIYTSLAHNVAGADVTETEDPQVQDLLRKYAERGRELFSENSEDALSWSTFHALSRLPSKAWLMDFLRAAVSEKFAQRYAPHADQARVRFWQPHPAPKVYQAWLGAKLRRDGEAAIAHLDRFEDKIRAKQRLSRILAGDASESPERPTEVDIEITVGKELLLFVEAKLYSDLRESGTFALERNQLVRNMELAAEAAKEYGYADWRVILLTLDRDRKKDAVYTKMMRRYRHSDMRLLRQWDRPGNIAALRADLPHRTSEPDAYFEGLSLRMGWVLWADMFKLLAHHAVS